MPERYQYPVDEGFADRIHTPEVRSLVVDHSAGVAHADAQRRPLVSGAAAELVARLTL